MKDVLLEELTVALARVRRVAALAGVTGCERIRRLEVRVQTRETASIRLGILPLTDVARLITSYGTFCRYLSGVTGQEVELVISPTYEQLGFLLESGSVEAAWFSSASFSLARGGRECVPIARVVREGGRSYVGAIIVRNDSPIRAVSDLRGRSFAYVDRHSGSGFSAPNTMMVAAGLQPPRDLGEVTFTGGNQASIRGVIERSFDAAAIYIGALATYPDRSGASQVRVLARSSPIPNGLVVVSGRVAPDVREKLRRAFLDILANPAGREALRSVSRYHRVDGFAPVEEKLETDCEDAASVMSDLDPAPLAGTASPGAAGEPADDE